MFAKFEELIIRPPRAVTTPDMLGPRAEAGRYLRSEVELRNPRGHRLVCSEWWPDTEDKNNTSTSSNNNNSRPVLVYAHANASNRSRAVEFRDLLMCMGVALFAFDFSGCGESDGDYVSLGLHESEDLAVVVSHLAKDPRCGPVALCGRSMGSSAVLLYAAARAAEHPCVCCVVLDGVFSSVRALMADIARSSSLFLSLLTPIGIPLLKRRIQDKADFSLDDVSPLGAAASVALPGLLLVAKSDALFPAGHAKQVAEAYRGKLQTVEIEGDHNSYRGADFWNAVSAFLAQHLNVPAPAPLGASVASVTPFRLREGADGELELEPEWEHWLPGPVTWAVESDGLRFSCPYRPGSPTVMVLRFALFQGMDAAPGLMRVMLSPNSGLLIQTPQAEALQRACDAAICAMLRDGVLRDPTGFMERIKHAARTLLQRKGVSPSDVAQQLENVTVRELGLGEDDALRRRIHEAVDAVVAEERARDPDVPGTLRMSN